jgi:DNA-binding transcriptional LysR family regulator
VIDIRLLLDFAAVGEALSFSEAARKTNIAQPRLSAQIRKLEDILGMTLFDRTTRRVAFTPAGQHLYELVRPTAKAAESLLAEVMLIRSGQTGRLSLGTIVLGEPDRRLSNLIAGFAADHPDADICIESGLPHVHLTRLAERSLDLACCVEWEPATGYETLRLHPVYLAVMMGQGDPLAEVAEIHPEQLAGRRVAMLQRARNPSFFDRCYAPILAAGAEPVYAPELRRTLLRDVPDLIVTTMVPGTADARLRHGIVRRGLAGMPEMWLTLARLRASVQSSLADAFWEYCRKSAPRIGA